MAQINNPEVRKSEGLYGTSIFDHISDGLVNSGRRLIHGLRNPSLELPYRISKLGTAFVVLGVIVTSVEFIPTADVTPEKVAIRAKSLRDSKERLYGGLGLCLFGSATIATGLALEERRRNQESAERARRRMSIH